VSSVRIGAYSLEVATLGGSFAQFETEPETENAQALETALEEEAGKPPAAIAAIEHFEETADDVTGRVEQADKLLRTAAAGDLLQLDNVTGEVDALLDLFSRLDRAGRFEEELKLMRSLNGLLALTLRWLDLIRSLRSLLRSAKAANHAAGQAYAHHELGSLHLCAGRTEAAEHHLREAYRLQSRIGDLTGQCATRHNLDSARRDALSRAPTPPSSRLLRSAAIAAGFVLLGGGGGSAIALSIHRTHHRTPTGTPVARVTVAVEGQGAGFVRGDGVNCPADCATLVDQGSRLRLRAIARPGSAFLGWKGANCANADCPLRAGRDRTLSALFTRRASDTQAPTTPTGLSARTVSASQIDLTWSPSTDNVRVTAYVIYRNDTKLTTVPGSSYQDTGLAASTAYEYRVQALDAAGNASERSAPRKAKTRSAPDTQPPTTPAGLQATPVSTSEIDLSWSASTDDSGSVAGYVIYRDGQKLTTVSGTTTTYPDTGLTEGTTYTYTVQALDATGNASNQSDPQEAMTKAILK
jgi:chitodextrinase